MTTDNNAAPSGLTDDQRRAIEWAIGMASQHNIHKSPLRALLPAAPKATEQAGGFTRGYAKGVIEGKRQAAEQAPSVDMKRLRQGIIELRDGQDEPLEFPVSADRKAGWYAAIDQVLGEILPEFEAAEQAPVADAAQSVPIYQIQRLDGAWKDVQPFANAGKHGRVVFGFALTQQPARASEAGEVLTDAELAALIRKVEDGLGIVWFVPDDSETFAWRTTNTNERNKFARTLLAERAIVPAQQAVTLTDAARDVLAEHRRQLEQEGWTAEHDDEHDEGEMASAAAAYAAHSCGWNDGAVRDLWPPQWHLKWLKTSTPRRDLVKAGALILAEIERIDRAEGNRSPIDSNQKD